MLPLLPAVPTLAEGGARGYEFTVWWGLVAPAQTPAAIVTRLNTEINAILGEPEMAKRLQTEAADPVIGPPEAFGKLIASEMIKWARIAKQANIRAE